MLELGWPFFVYVILLLLSGCCLGLLLMALLFRFGLAAEWAGWMSTYAILPLIAHGVAAGAE